MDRGGADSVLSVSCLDTDRLTLPYLHSFLHHHGHPDTIYLHAADFARLSSDLHAVSEKDGTALYCLGTRWVRTPGDTKELHWGAQDLRCRKRRD